MDLKKIVILSTIMIAIALSSSMTIASPALNQSGNLVLNGNFETGTVDPWMVNHVSSVAISTEYKVDGEYSAFINTTIGAPAGYIGLYQYPEVLGGPPLPVATYTLSAWVYPIQGQAHIGLAWASGTERIFSSPTSSLYKWQFLEITYYAGGSGGPLLYGVSTIDKFYVDGAWLNEGETNLSPYAPQNGFADPNAVPIPGAVWLLGSGLIGLAALRSKTK